jgi:hypothetical protein
MGGVLTHIGLVKVLWMVVRLNGEVAGVFLDEPMPDYMTEAECVVSAVQRQALDQRKGVTYRCEWSTYKPFQTGRFYRRLE